MVRRELIELVGEETYLNAVQSLRAGTSISTDFVHNIPSHLETIQLNDEQTWEIWKALVHELPVYSVWMYARIFYVNRATKAQKQELHVIFAHLFEKGTPAQTEAAKYSLWVDFFEDPATVEDCWRHLERTLKSEHARAYLMEISGPVPYALKKSYYESFLGTNSERDCLRIGIQRSCTDLYGSIDQEHAFYLVGRIETIDPGVDMTEVRALLKEVS